jgi:AhpD family alkylhydroperoxidase
LGTTATGAGLRLPEVKRDTPDGYRALAALTRAGLDDHALSELLKLRASQINACMSCTGWHDQLLRKAGETDDRVAALAGWRTSERFTPRERAALALTEALTLVAQGPVPEAVMAEAADHFPGAELARLVMSITAINAWNRVSIATKGPFAPGD